MTRRRKTTRWSRAVAGAWKALGEIGRVQTRAAAKSAKLLQRAPALKMLKPPRPPARAPGGDWVAGVAAGPAGLRRFYLSTPPRTARSERLPLLVMLHGCGQSAHAFAAATRMNGIALRQRFAVLYAEQDRSANLQGCWNWFETDTRAAYREAATLMAAIDQVVLLHRVDPGRVAVAGFSAGAGMAALLASRYPARFRAVAMHSGVPPGIAHSKASALRAMLGRGAAAAPDASQDWPPLLVIHGSADHVVAPSNGDAAAELWAAAAGARRHASRSVQRGRRRAMTVTDFKAQRRTAATLCVVDGLGHAWSGGSASQPFSDAQGPDAARLIAAFVARRFGASG